MVEVFISIQIDYKLAQMCVMNKPNEIQNDYLIVVLLRGTNIKTFYKTGNISNFHFKIPFYIFIFFYCGFISLNKTFPFFILIEVKTLKGAGF